MQGLSGSCIYSLVSDYPICYYNDMNMLNDEMKREFIALRKQIIADQFSRLNDKQVEAVLATEGPLLILAGAGSGKTTVLINRIENLIRFGRASDCRDVPEEIGERELEILRNRSEGFLDAVKYYPVEPWRILAITFTNKAALELKSRLSNKLGPEAEDIWACTFHSACVRILRREADKLGFSSDFTIYDTDDSISLIKKIEKDFAMDPKDFAPRSILYEISRAKNAGITSEEYESSVPSYDFRKKKTAPVYREYMIRMFRANAMDFDDLICFTVKVLNENEETRSYWQRRFKYILVDEYQDTNHLQYVLVSLLSGDKGNICAVGDDDQSIYKFRGATIDNILNFENRFSNCRTIRLEQNYRSSSHILDAANAVISNNVSRKGKTLWTNNGTGEPVELFFADNQTEEAEFVASKIIGLRTQGDNWRDNAVLYRMNAQSSQFEIAFKRYGIPYRVIGGMKFFERAEIKDILSYLCVINNPNDDLRLTRIINVPVRGIGARTIEAIQSAAVRNGSSMYEIICHPDSHQELKKSAAKLTAFRQMIDRMRAFAECNTSDAVFDNLLEETGYLKLLEEHDTPEDTARAENVKELKSGILSFISETGDTSLNSYLTEIALYTDTDSYDGEDDTVSLMTVHSAKGLEFTNVFLTGMEETIFPGIKSIGDPDEIEEERRLCYVAITRAKKILLISAARQRMLFGKTASNCVSRFVEEIPEEHIKKQIPRRYSYHDTDRAAESSQNRFTKFEIKPAPRQAEEISEDFSTGDDVFHRAFGEGTIVSMKPMGGDYLVEINFVKSGSKKLMLKAARAYMKKN